MPPLPESGAAAHDIVQMLFYFVCVLSFAIGSSIVWFAKYMLLPLRDGHLQHLANTKQFMDKMEQDNEKRSEMHRENLEKLEEIHELQKQIKDRIKCPTTHHPQAIQVSP